MQVQVLSPAPIWPHRLTDRTPDSQSGNGSSILPGATILEEVMTWKEDNPGMESLGYEREEDFPGWDAHYAKKARSAQADHGERLRRQYQAPPKIKQPEPLPLEEQNCKTCFNCITKYGYYSVVDSRSCEVFRIIKDEIRRMEAIG